MFEQKKYTTSDLQLKIGDYIFEVESLYSGDGDIILGSQWMETLGSFILNVNKRFLIFHYKKKKITLQDFSMKLKMEAPSLKYFKEITKMILKDNENST